jgi:hypothetical protein
MFRDDGQVPSSSNWRWNEMKDRAAVKMDRGEERRGLVKV